VVNKCWISIDPGIGGTGIAVWKLNARKYAPTQALLNSYTITPKAEEWCDRAAEIGETMTSLLYYNNKYEPVRAYFELPALMGMATARRGDLV
jgi:hypothetical protein